MNRFKINDVRVLAVILLIVAGESHGQIVAPSTYSNALTVTGEVAGTEFDDWAAAGIPIAFADPADNPDGIDINEIQIANDSQYIYIRATFHSAKSLGGYISFDTDQDFATGYDLFGLATLGAELSYVNDFAFEQSLDEFGAGVFNTGNPLTGGPFANGGAPMFPDWQTEGSAREWAIPLDASFSNPTAPALPSDAFNFWLWTDGGQSDVPSDDFGPLTISYTLAANPGGILNCDADGADACDLADLNALYAAIGTAGSQFDYSGDGLVGSEDIASWLAEASSAVNTLNTTGQTYVLGDADLNGAVTSADLGLLLNNFGANSEVGWNQGDLDASGNVDSTDLGLLLNNFGHASAFSANAVPEPSLNVLFLVGMIVCFVKCRLR